MDTWQMLILDEVDRMSKDAQHSLRRTMEKYTAACRIVLCCNNVSKVWDWMGLLLLGCPCCAGAHGHCQDCGIASHQITSY